MSMSHHYEFWRWLGMPIVKERDEFYMENTLKDKSDDELGFTVSVDNIQPGHYNFQGNDPFKYCLDNGLGGLEHTVVKYVTRWKKKGGIEDLRKARETLDRLIKYHVNEME